MFRQATDFLIFFFKALDSKDQQLKILQQKRVSGRDFPPKKQLQIDSEMCWDKSSTVHLCFCKWKFKETFVTLQLKPHQKYFLMVLSIFRSMLPLPTMESVDEIFWCDFSNKIIPFRVTWALLFQYFNKRSMKKNFFDHVGN